jgi:hypothetical protein
MTVCNRDCRSIKLLPRLSLFGSNSPALDIGSRVILSPHWSAGDPTKHRNLSNVGERVCDRSLEKSLTGSVKLFIGFQILV